MHVYQDMDWGVTQAARRHIAVLVMRIRLLCRTFTVWYWRPLHAWTTIVQDEKGSITFSSCPILPLMIIVGISSYSPVVPVWPIFVEWIVSRKEIVRVPLWIRLETEVGCLTFSTLFRGRWRCRVGIGHKQRGIDRTAPLSRRTQLKGLQLGYLVSRSYWYCYYVLHTT
jgi:hypothetical protein